MNTAVIPQSYAQRGHCVEYERDIPLTLAYVDERLRVWCDLGNEKARRFAQIYGEKHRRPVQQFFEQARSALV